MTALRKDLPPLPRRFLGLPIDDRGYPVPWFVHWVDGKPDFRLLRPDGAVEAFEKRKCWLCGDRLGRYGAFVVGPMGPIIRIAAEPPSHRDCAEFAVKACPFLVRPNAKRREANLTNASPADDGMILGNPGVSLLWVTRLWRPVGTPDRVLFNMADPTEFSWWREGRPATRGEVIESIKSILPDLVDIAARENLAAVKSLEKPIALAMQLLPAA